MPHTRLLFLAALAALTASCDPASPITQPPQGEPEEPKSGAPVAPSLASLELGIESQTFYQGSVTQVFLKGYASDGRILNVDSAVITSSDPSVVALTRPRVFTWKDNLGNTARGLYYVATTQGPGDAVLRASLYGVTKDLALQVHPLPPVASSIVIDSFTVVEYRAACAWNCPYLAYAPLLKLREPTGQSPVYLETVEVNLPTQSTGLCNVGRLRLEPGFVGHINAIKDYLWDNDMIVVQLDGTPLPAGDASVRIIFRDAQGKAGMAQAKGTIQRGVNNPVFPSSPFAQVLWSCAFHYVRDP